MDKMASASGEVDRLPTLAHNPPSALRISRRIYAGGLKTRWRMFDGGIRDFSTVHGKNGGGCFTRCLKRTKNSSVTVGYKRGRSELYPSEVSVCDLAVSAGIACSRLCGVSMTRGGSVTPRPEMLAASTRSTL